MAFRRNLLCAYGVFPGRVNALAAVFLSLLLILPVSASADIRILALGDSLTAGYGVAAGQSFPDQLERALSGMSPVVRIINGGVSGDTTAAGLARLDWLLSDKPDAAIVELGANDGLRALKPTMTFKNLDTILTRFRDRGIPVLLTGMRAPPNLGPEYVAAFDGVFMQLVKKHDVVFYPFFLDGVATMRDLNQADGIHPTAEGVAVIVARIRPYVEKLLTRIEIDGRKRARVQ